MQKMFPSIKTVGKFSTNQMSMFCRMASSYFSLPSSPLYELRMYAFHPKDFKAANELFTEKFHLRVKHSKLVGFWNSEIGDHITQVVHIWEYDDLNHRRKVRTAMAGDEDWTKQFVANQMPRIANWTNSLLVSSPGSDINLDFTKDPSAVYLLDQVKVDNYKELPNLPDNKSELLVGRFCGILGPSKTEYRLWRYTDANDATEGCIRRASETPFEGSTMLLYPSSFSPMQ